jgi:alcohol dehydrogenase class IV
MAANVEIMQARDSENPALRRYDEVAQLLTGDPAATARDGVAWARSLCATLQIPPLGDYGLTAADFDSLIENAARSNSMKGNPAALTPDDLRGILERAL